LEKGFAVVGWTELRDTPGSILGMLTMEDAYFGIFPSDGVSVPLLRERSRPLHGWHASDAIEVEGRESDQL